jgi:hypothetical protein
VKPRKRTGAHNPAIENKSNLWTTLFGQDWFDHQNTARALLRFLDLCCCVIHLLPRTWLPSLCAPFVACHHVYHPPPQTEPHIRCRAAFRHTTSHIISQPYRPSGWRRFATGFCDSGGPLLGLGMGMAAADTATEKEVSASGLPGGRQDDFICVCGVAFSAE